jgi:hypothetical protein
MQAGTAVSPTGSWSDPGGMRWFWAAAGAMLLVLWVIGSLHPWISPDTPSYLDLPGWPACLAGTRLPLYGWLVTAVGGTRAVPSLQTLGFIPAAASLTRALHRAGLSPADRLAAGLGVLCSTEFMRRNCLTSPGWRAPRCGWSVAGRQSGLRAVGVLLAGLYVWRRARQIPPTGPPPSNEIDTLVLVSGTFTLAASLLIVLVTFPAVRYVDSAGILLPLRPAYGVLRLGPWLRAAC